MEENLSLLIYIFSRKKTEDSRYSSAYGTCAFNQKTAMEDFYMFAVAAY